MEKYEDQPPKYIICTSPHKVNNHSYRVNRYNKSIERTYIYILAL